MALGNIHEAEQLIKSYPKLQHIKAIVKYHSDADKMKSKEIFQTLASQDSLASYNFRLLRTAEISNADFVSLDNFKDDWIGTIMNRKSALKNCDPLLSANFNSNFLLTVCLRFLIFS